MASTFHHEELNKFRECHSKLLSLNFRSEEQTKTDLNILLDELNSLRYPLHSVSSEVGSQLIGKAISLAPPHHVFLYTKVCQLINGLLEYERVVLSDACLHDTIDYVQRGLQVCQSWTHAEILHTLAAILTDNKHRIEKYLPCLLGEHGVLRQLFERGLIAHDDDDDDILCAVLLCLEHLCYRDSTEEYMDDEYIRVCYEMFLRVLRIPKAELKVSPNTYCTIIIYALRGIHSILLAAKTVTSQQLGPVLAVVKAYMLYGLTSQPVSVAATLYPSVQAQQEPQTTVTPQSNVSSKPAEKTQGKKIKKKKRGKKDVVNDELSSEKSDTDAGSGQSQDDASLTSFIDDDAGDELSLRPRGYGSSGWRMFSSDSEFSDSESGQTAKSWMYTSRVRRRAAGLLVAIAKVCEKKVLFGYWSSFLPDSPPGSGSPQTSTLFTCILKDPKPKCRLGATIALTSLLDGAKPYLAAADDSTQSSVAFTPYSSVLGSMIKELHRSLLLAMVAENHILTLTQLIKCLGMLISNCPYHRLKPGLLSRVWRQLRHFTNHNDTHIRVACMTCLGSMIALQPPLLEICHIIQTVTPPVTSRTDLPVLTADRHENQPDIARSDVHSKQESKTDTNNEHEKSAQPLTDSLGRGDSAGFIDNSRNLVGETVSALSNASGSPALTSPPTSGSITPLFSEHSLQGSLTHTPWVVKLCVKNVLPQTPEGALLPGLYPVQVRLESLQVLCQMCKNYFPVVRHCLSIFEELILACLYDNDAKNPSMKLHGSKLLNELGRSVLKDLENTEIPKDQRVSHDKVQLFWQNMMKGPMISLLQTPSNGQVRAELCDSVGNIGADIFQQLPLDHRMLCITLCLGLAIDEERIVRGSAVRTLGVYCLYPSLRQDVSFIADCVNAVLQCLEDKSVHVRIKASWAAGNLSDALVINKDTGDTEFVESFSDMLILKLLDVAKKGTQDSDKVRSSAVRTIGNLLHYATERIVEKPGFPEAVESAVKAVVKNINSGVMKVRWNSCYALYNIFKNTLILFDQAGWMGEVFTGLCTAVKECKNFKVRINAALALSGLSMRDHYSDHFMLVWSSLIFALGSADKMLNFLEYKYRDSLTDQTCLAILHLAHLMTADDLVSLTSIGDHDYTVLEDHLQKWRSKSDSKKLKAALVLKMKVHLRELIHSELSEKQKTGLSLLEHLCQTLSADFSPVEDKPAFKQTYD